jgi:hypothetical protein
MERRDIIRTEPQQQQIEKTVDDRLAKLAEEFARFAKAKDITPKPSSLTLDDVRSPTHTESITMEFKEIDGTNT